MFWIQEKLICLIMPTLFDEQNMVPQQLALRYLSIFKDTLQLF